MLARADQLFDGSFGFGYHAFGCLPGVLLRPQNPPLDFGHRALGRCQRRIEEPCEAAVEIGSTHPCGGGIGIQLVGAASFRREAVAP